jgi:uncharacterized membrane protein YtjA (UPF0391 family)
MRLLHWALICLIIAIIAGLLGLTGIARRGTGMGRFLFVLSLVAFLVVLLLMLLLSRSWTPVKYIP